MSNTSNISFPGLLTVLFIALKLTNVIAWSWVWVLAPLWIGLAIFLTCFFGLIALAIGAKQL